jgi:hypothetical protein
MKKMKGSFFFFLLKNGDWLEQVIWWLLSMVLLILLVECYSYTNPNTWKCEFLTNKLKIFELTQTHFNYMGIVL